MCFSNTVPQWLSDLTVVSQGSIYNNTDPWWCQFKDSDYPFGISNCSYTLIIYNNDITEKFYVFKAKSRHCICTNNMHHTWMISHQSYQLSLEVSNVLICCIEFCIMLGIYDSIWRLTKSRTISTDMYIVNFTKKYCQSNCIIQTRALE
jgi:hypothetical protein